jgi:hypothetical protein
MGYRGDIGGNYAIRAPHGRLIYMTAISILYTPPGFVIGADGRKRDSEDHSIVDDHTQKIFQIPGMQIGYALMGSIELSPEGSKEISFKFSDQIVITIEALGHRSFRDLFEYATELATPINKRLADARRAGVIGPYPAQPSQIPGPGLAIAHVFLTGYYQGKPARVDIRFFHEDQKLLDPLIERRPPGPLLMGPGALVHRILDDERFAKYRPEWDGTLPGAAEISKQHILAFSGPEALEIDREASLGVGPNVHIATITLGEGFQWIEGFKPKGIK